MGTSIERRTRTDALALTTSTTTTAQLAYGAYSGGTIHVPTGSSITTLTYYAYDHEAAAYSALYDADGVAVTQTVAATNAYPILDSAYGVRTLVLVANAAGTVNVDLKG
jgi:hypothetical protein